MGDRSSDFTIMRSLGLYAHQGETRAVLRLQLSWGYPSRQG